MKKVMVIMLACWFVGCGGFLDNLGSVDTEEVSDGGLSPDLPIQCERICSGFVVFDCLPVLMQAIPVGRSLKSTWCVDRCQEFAAIYQEMNEHLDLGCLETATSCQGVASCLGVINKEAP